MESMAENRDLLKIGAREFGSRLLACVAGQFYPGSRCLSLKTAIEVIESSGTEFLIYNVMMPKEIRQTPNGMPSEVITIEEVLGKLNSGPYAILNNTNRCTTVEEAVEKGIHSASITGSPLVKLEILDQNLFPVNAFTLEAAGRLIQEGLEVLPLITQDLRAASELRDLGCPAIRVSGSPIGSMRGVQTPERFEKICSKMDVPIIAEGEWGAPLRHARQCSWEQTGSWSMRPLPGVPTQDFWRRR